MQLLQVEWNFFLRGGPRLGGAGSDLASPSWIPPGQWDQIVQLGEAVAGLEGIGESMRIPTESVAWQEWAGSSQPHLHPMPPAWETVCTSFQRLLLLKVSLHAMAATHIALPCALFTPQVYVNPESQN